MEESNKKKELFSSAMKGEWDKVIGMYKEDASLHNARITRSEQTALHIAVSDGKEHIVSRMLQAMMQGQRDQKELVVNALRTGNRRNNTALHSAASMGNVTICRLIAGMDATLVDDRNKDGETPLFLAALYGRKQAFLLLHSIRNPDITAPPFYVNCRRNNGDTILHSAINGDYFDLAFQIIHLYNDLANSMNEEGLSSLHLLASKPCAFRSGSHLGRMETIIYHCIYVEKLKVEKSCECPTCRSPVTPRHVDKKDIDAEDPGVGGDGGRANPFSPVNYETCCDLIKFFYLLLMIILGKGSEGFRKIYRKKETHIWSVQIVEKLAIYDYGDGGSEPQDSSARSISQEDKPSSVQVKDGEQSPKTRTKDTPMLVAGKSGMTKETIEKIELFREASQYLNEDKNIKSLAVDKEDKQLPKRRTKEIPILVAAKSGVNMETIEKIVELFPEGIQYLNEDKNLVLFAVDKEDKQLPKGTKETPILVAAKNGVMEIIEKIVQSFPVAIHDLNEDNKNMVLLAVEHRQPHVYQFLLKNNVYKESLFHQLDKDGNSALHLAARYGDNKPWLIPGEALQMHWEYKWYKFVKEAMPPNFFGRYNNKKETAHAVFTKTHKQLEKTAADWLNKTSESCSVVAALIATVAFTTASTVPGGVRQEIGHPDSGHPILEDKPEFQLFAISAILALGFSIMALVMFLSILSSRFQEQDFENLPRKLLVGLTSLFISITSMLVSFCAGHFFVLEDELHFLSLLIYGVACLPVTLFVLAQFPLYFDLIRATFTHVPQRSHRAS